jgi:hypothetical protein
MMEWWNNGIENDKKCSITYLQTTLLLITISNLTYLLIV